MPEILYRNEEHKFSVYRLCDIPDGVRRSGYATLDYWRALRARPTSGDSGKPRTTPDLGEEFAAVLDENARPLLSPAPFKVISRPVAITAEEYHRERTKRLGAKQGEHIGCKSWSSEARAAWSAHLRFLVDRSERERQSKEPSVGWDPYGDDL